MSFEEQWSEYCADRRREMEDDVRGADRPDLETLLAEAQERNLSLTQGTIRTAWIAALLAVAASIAMMLLPWSGPSIIESDPVAFTDFWSNGELP